MPTGPAAKLKFTQQPSGTVISGAVLARQPIVEVEDARGHPVKTSGTSVTIGLFETTGTLGGQLTALTDAAGRAHFTGILINGSGDFYLKATSGSLVYAKSARVKVVPVASPTVDPGTVLSPFVSVSPISVASEGSVVVSWGNVASPSVGDYVQLWIATETPTDTGTFAYTSSGTETPGATAHASGTVTIVMPAEAGSYLFKLISGATDEVLATSQTVVVQSAAASPDTGITWTGLSTWETNMLSKGATHAAYIAAHKNDTDITAALSAVYYDAMQVYAQIAEYTSDNAWYDAVTDAKYIYWTRYASHTLTYEGLPGGVPAYWNFTTGLRKDFERIASASSKAGVVALSQNAAFSPDSTPVAWSASVGYTRETAYTVRGYIEAENCGEPRRTRRDAMVTQLYGHAAQFIDPTTWGTDQVAPFQAGLMANVLIMEWQQSQDARCIPALRLLADYLWANAWVVGDNGMKYGLNPNSGSYDPVGAPDLNMLIAPMYAFLWWQTGETRHRDRGDTLFAAGVAHANLDGSKQFNQNYEFSFDYVKMRRSRAS
jgi:hypothetical protein